MDIPSLPFDEIWLVDFEFSSAPGENPHVICLVALELRSQKKLRVWQDGLIGTDHPPYNIDATSLFIAYYASAEINCHLALGWPLPVNILDLYVEFRNHTNGLTPAWGTGLLGALVWFELPTMETTEKDAMRQLALRGGPWTNEEQKALLEYCESDVVALVKLLLAMVSSLDIDRALIRGRYMRTAAVIESNGIPMDNKKVHQLLIHWPKIQNLLIAKIDDNYAVYEGNTFRRSRFITWLKKYEIPWPRISSGSLDLSDDTFKMMSQVFPKVAPLRELRKTLAQMKKISLAIGKEARNRCLLSAFRARTGRNQPSNSQFIFGQPTWLRCLIKPPKGIGLAYIDWSQQEFGIAAALSKDPLMIKAYLSGDPYLEFAKQAGSVPPDATKHTHKIEREQFKACVLAVQYGMGAESLAFRIQQPIIRARQLLHLHQDTYKVFWQWSNAAVDYAMLHGKLWTVFGWMVHTKSNAKWPAISS